MSESEAQIRIPFDKKKIRWKLFAAICIMTIGVLSRIMSLKSNNQFLPGGYVFIFLSLVLLYQSLKRINTNKPGFIIDAEGIQDYTGSFYVSPIFWRDVTKIRVVNKLWYMIVIDVNNPQAYINREKNVFNKLSMSINHVILGSPFCLTPRDLNISLNDLFEAIDGNFKNYKGR